MDTIPISSANRLSFHSKIDSGLRITVDPKPTSKIRENGCWVPEIQA